MKSLTYSDIAIEDIESGIYIGECNVDFIYAKVAVTEENGAITQIEILEHKNERGIPTEKIFDNILQQQSIDVDAISGATNSSKVIKKAVENALMAGCGRAEDGDNQSLQEGIWYQLRQLSTPQKMMKLTASLNLANV